MIKYAGLNRFFRQISKENGISMNKARKEYTKMTKETNRIKREQEERHRQWLNQRFRELDKETLIKIAKLINVDINQIYPINIELKE